MAAVPLQCHPSCAHGRDGDRCARGCWRLRSVRSSIADYNAQSAVERELVLRLASLLWRLRRATAMETGLFEIQAEHLRGFKQAIHPTSRDVVYALFGRQKLCPAPCRSLSRLPVILPPSSRVAFCVLPICPTTHSIASAGMKQPFGAKPARSCLRLAAWIAANHTIEGAVGSITKQRPNANEKSGRN
jgi:hypothetical protein